MGLIPHTSRRKGLEGKQRIRSTRDSVHRLDCHCDPLLSACRFTGPHLSGSAPDRNVLPEGGFDRALVTRGVPARSDPGHPQRHACRRPRERIVAHLRQSTNNPKESYATSDTRQVIWVARDRRPKGFEVWLATLQASNRTTRQPMGFTSAWMADPQFSDRPSKSRTLPVTVTSRT